MSIAESASTTRHLPRLRVGRFVVPLVLLAGLLVGGYLVAKPMLGGSADNGSERVIVQKVERGTFEHIVTEPGELESSNNVEVRCEVEARGSTGTVILEIVPNGAEVNVGDFLVRFDSSALLQERNQQQISVNDAKALVIQSRTALDTAEISKKEYVEGTFTQEEQLLLGELFVAEENLRRAEEYAKYSERLAAKGYVTSDQVEADKFAVEKGKNDVAAVNTKLKVLREYTKAKQLKTLDAAIETADGKLKSDKFTLDLAEEKLKHLDEQIKKCVVNSPAAGKVVYANRTDRRGGSEVIVEEGAIIRERQPVLRLPDLTKMQVLAKINETRVSHVRKEMKAQVTVDAFPGMKLDGRVVRVDEYPVPPGWMAQNIKQYATYIALDNPPEGVRPGLTVQVEINVDTIPNSLMVPIQSVFERNGEYYCVVRSGGRFEPKWLDIGPTNDQDVLIRSGVEEGQEVVLDPEPLVANVELPKAPLGYWESHPRYERLVRRTPGDQPVGMTAGGGRPNGGTPAFDASGKGGASRAENPAGPPSDGPPAGERRGRKGRPPSAGGSATANSAG
jgi:HlyD family secretion protein